jgi:hypothetical protein
MGSVNSVKRAFLSRVFIGQRVSRGVEMTGFFIGGLHRDFSPL